MYQNWDSPRKTRATNIVPQGLADQITGHFKGEHKSIKSAVFIHSLIYLKTPADTISWCPWQNPDPGVYHQFQRPEIIPMTRQPYISESWNFSGSLCIVSLKKKLYKTWRKTEKHGFMSHSNKCFKKKKIKTPNILSVMFISLSVRVKCL